MPSDMFLILSLLLSCVKRPLAVSPVAIALEPAEDGSLLQRIDNDLDGVVDILNVYSAAGLLSRREVDTNHDGRVDLISAFDDAGRISRVDVDEDTDGRIDYEELYWGGALRLRRRNLNEDWRWDQVEHYSEGVLVLTELDADGDGSMDAVSTPHASGSPAGEASQ